MVMMMMMMMMMMMVILNTTTLSCYVNFSGCGHCKAMKPAYMDAAQELANKNVNTWFRPV